MSEMRAPAIRLFKVTLKAEPLARTNEFTRLVMAHSVDLHEGALRFHDWVPLPEELQGGEALLQALNRRGFAAGTWLEYEEVTGSQAKGVQ